MLASGTGCQGLDLGTVSLRAAFALDISPIGQRERTHCSSPISRQHFHEKSSFSQRCNKESLAQLSTLDHNNGIRLRYTIEKPLFFKNEEGGQEPSRTSNLDHQHEDDQI